MKKGQTSNWGFFSAEALSWTSHMYAPMLIYKAHVLTSSKRMTCTLKSWSLLFLSFSYNQ